jgi:ribosomal protein S18 acetylase RimI-like enzyme
MNIRAARRDDFEAVVRLLEELGRPVVGAGEAPDARAVYDEQVVDPNAHHMVAEGEGGELVAFCSMHFRTRLNWPSPEAWMPDLIVTETARRAGIARALLDEAQRRARERGCHSLTLESGYRRAEAHHLYRQFGMRDSGKQFYKALRARSPRA